MFKELSGAFLVFTLISGVWASFPLVSSSVPNDFEYLGLAGYVTSQTALEETVEFMERKGLNAYRVSFKPSWQVPDGAVKGYNTDFIDYLLLNTDFFVVVDGNHLYPSSEISAQNVSSLWVEVTNRVFQILERYPNNPRVAVELINEYPLDDYDTRMQNLVDQIRDLGYTNPLVANKLQTNWLKISDPLDNTYHGMHFYFDTWNSTRALNQIKIALGRNITKILNTEVGASSNEYKTFNQKNIDELGSFLLESQALGVDNCIWMNVDTQNWPGYMRYNFDVLGPAPTPMPILPPTLSPTTGPTFKAEASPTPRPVPTPNPTVTSAPTPTPDPASSVLHPPAPSNSYLVIYSGSTLISLKR